MYTTEPASPLRKAFTLSFNVALFKPSAPVKPFNPDTPSLPSRPLEAVSPTLANWSFTACANSTVIVSPFAVVTMLVLSPLTCNVPFAKDKPTFSVA